MTVSVCVTKSKLSMRPALLAYLALMLSSMASLLFLWKSSGVIWTRSAIFVLRASQTAMFSNSALELSLIYQDEHCDFDKEECFSLGPRQGVSVSSL